MADLPEETASAHGRSAGSEYARILGGLLLPLVEDHDPARAAEDREARRRREAADLRLQQQETLVHCGVPAKHAAIIAAGRTEETAATTTVRKWLAQGPRRLLALLGAKDSGKTFASGLAVDLALAAWVREPGRRAGPPVFIAAEFLADTWLYFDRTDNRIAPNDPVTGLNRKALLECALLVIDDSGHEPGHKTEQTGEATDILICRRCDRGLRTLVTSNYKDYAELLARYPSRAQRLTERFMEHGMTTPYLVSTNMRRRRARGEEATGT